MRVLEPARKGMATDKPFDISTELHEVTLVLANAGLDLSILL